MIVGWRWLTVTWRPGCAARMRSWVPTNHRSCPSGMPSPACTRTPMRVTPTVRGRRPKQRWPWHPRIASSPNSSSTPPAGVATMATVARARGATRSLELAAERFEQLSDALRRYAALSDGTPRSSVALAAAVVLAAGARLPDRAGRRGPVDRGRGPLPPDAVAGARSLRAIQAAAAAAAARDHGRASAAPAPGRSDRRAHRRPAARADIQPSPRARGSRSTSREVGRTSSGCRSRQIRSG